MHAISRMFARFSNSQVLISNASRRRRRLFLWLWALLTPIVLVLGLHWKINYFRGEDFSIEVNRAAMLAIAAEYLQERGIEFDGTTPRFRMNRNSELLKHLHWLSQQSSSDVRISELPTTPVVFVVVYGEQGNEGREVHIAPDGRVVGFSLGVPDRGLFVPDDARQSALRLAEAFLQSALRFQERYRLSEPRVYEQTGDSGEPVFRVEWTAVHLNASELSFVLRFGIANEQMFSHEIVADVDDEAVAGSGFTYMLRETLTSIAPFYFMALVIYMLTRYLQRALEKEVSHVRALVVSLYLVAMMGAIFLAGDAQLLMNVESTQPGAFFIWVFAAVMLSTLALFAGACYAACEGDVRERFPRSLTSFDALLIGRVFSRNVARAFLFGFSAACWLFTFHVLVNLKFEGGLEEPGSIVTVYQLVASAVPYLYVFLLLPVAVGLVMLLGFMAPLSVIARFKRIRWLAWILLVGMSFTNLVILHGGYTTAAGLFLTIGAETALLLWLAVSVDVLTAYVCLVLSGYLTMLTNAQLLTALPHDVQWLMHGVVASTVLVSLVLMRWGRNFTDEAVRPSYARALAERQMLSLQLSAAALAQRQLMVREVPALEGFSVAAECKTAAAVSGDYFDCYPIDRYRMGVLLISGAGRGLLDAMVIAFAKGFLLEHARLANSPKELLAELLQTLTSVLEPADRYPELCYLLLDGEDRSASYVRTPGFPEIVRIRDRDERMPSVRGSGSDELASTLSLRGGRSIVLLTEVVPLSAGSTLLTYTCGFASSLHLSGVLDVREWLRQQWSRLASPSARSMLARITDTAFARTRAWQQFTPQEDLTLLVVRYTGEVNLALGVPRVQQGDPAERAS